MPTKAEVYAARKAAGLCVFCGNAVEPGTWHRAFPTRRGGGAQPGCVAVRTNA